MDIYVWAQPKHKYADYLENQDSLNKSGHLEVAKWLWSLDQNINIHAWDEWAFRLSCSRGYLEVAKWLWSLDQNINIYANNDFIFRFSCEYGYLEEAKWLCTICDNYYLEHDVNDVNKIIGYKILTNKEVEKKNLVDLLNLGITIDSNTTINL